VIDGIEYVDLLAMAEADGAALKPISSTEYAGPCPRCGGNDRLHVLTKSRQGKPIWFCGHGNGCHTRHGDAVDWLRHFHGMRFGRSDNATPAETAAVLAVLRRFGLPDNGRSGAARAAAPTLTPPRPRVVVVAGVKVPTDDELLKQALMPPSDEWQNAATITAMAARDRLRTPAAVRAAVYLYQRRHLLPATVDRFALGWLPASTTTGPMGWRAATAGAISVPWSFAGHVWRVQYRAVGDVPKDQRFQQKKKDPNFVGALPPFNGDTIAAAHTVLVVEGEMDCMLGAQLAPAGVAVVTWGSCGTEPNVWALGLLAKKRVVVAMDHDGPGAAAAEKWRDLGELVTVPAGKDLGDYADLHGVDALRAWIAEVTR
jgi:DNA primase